MTAIRVRHVVAASVALAVLGVAAACGRGAAPAPASGPRADAARLQRTNAQLEKQIELAAGKEFYLVLDPATSGLTLMLKGAPLQRFTVIGLQVGHPRTAWFGDRDPRHVQSVIWSGGELDPPRQLDRLVIQAAAPGKEAPESAPPPIPPTPEELYPVPSRYHVRFADGLSMEILPREADATVGRWAHARAAVAEKWRDVLAALRISNRDAIRLRVTLDPADARSFYRSLPPAVRLIVLDGQVEPPQPAAAAADDGR
ncbi:MAG: hypothetical protein ACM3H9_00940 [Rhodospirillaceae bacterium]